MKTVKRRSQLQEKGVAKQFGARPTAASGALWGMKGDVRSDKFLIECKTTKDLCFSVTTKIWEKIETEAIKDHDRTPLLVVDLCDSERYVIFKQKYFNTKVGSDYDVAYGCNLSYRVCATHTTTMFELKAVKHRKDHQLFAIPIEDFELTFKEEL